MYCEVFNVERHILYRSMHQIIKQNHPLGYIAAGVEWIHSGVNESDVRARGVNCKTVPLLKNISRKATALRFMEY